MNEGQGSSFGAVDRGRANREATDWLILLQDEPDDAELRSRFDHWYGTSAVNAAAWAETLEVSERIVAIPPAYAGLWRNFPGSCEKTEALPAKRGKDRKISFGFLGGSRRMTGLATITAVAALAILAGPQLLLRMQADAQSGTGEVRTLHLADGSTVDMAPHSAVAIDVERGHRQVRVLRGSAYFDVTHDPAHPFRVLSGGTVTTVLGTAFEVREHADGEQVSVSVRRGLVSVACADRPQGLGKLTVGDVVDVTCNDGSSLRRKVEPSRIATWRQSQIVVSDRPVRDVIDALRPWHKGFIIALGSRLDSDRVTGVYDARRPERALRGLTAAHAITIRNITPWVTVVTAE